MQIDDDWKLAAGPLINPGRRMFLVASAISAGGLMIGARTQVLAAVLDGAAVRRPTGREAEITAWVRIAPDNQVTIIVSQAEIGQGISTTLPAILIDELGADWEKVRLETAPFAPAYRNPARQWMFTGNSESMQAFHDLMRSTGAAARTMLIQAAAARWQVSAADCRAEGGFIVHAPDGRRLAFGEVAAEAAGLPVPAHPVLKDARDLKLIGRALPRVDIPSKVDGSAVFGIDFRVPGMLLAAVRTAPTIGGTLRSVDTDRIKAMPGVRALVPLPAGVAVVADTYWQAWRALREVPPAFDEGPNAALSSASLMDTYRDKLEHGPWVKAVDVGQPLPLISHAARSLTSEYENPFAAHATMEPMNCTAHVTADRCEIWAPTQGQEFAHVVLMSRLGMKDEQVIVHRTDAIGGGFGRRLLPDFVVQAALVSKAVGKPVKLIWDREEDFLHDSYRPASLIRLTGALDAQGLPVAIAARVVSPTILLPVFPPIEKMLNEQGIDPSSLEGLMETPYALPNRRVDFHLLRTQVPTSVMRTTGYGPNLFAFESFIDELAHLARTDTYQYRRRLLAQNPRAVAVLDRAARIGQWGTPLPKGHGRGIAFGEPFGTLIAQVVEVVVHGPAVKVIKVASAVDCGQVLDPGIASACIEGGVVFGLAYCKTEITFKGGHAEQDNFPAYPLPYLAETPQMVTEFLQGGGKLGGVGEVGPVTVAPALANAIFAASGKRLRSMPLARHGLRFA